ncbi:MAG: transcriptional regulator [Sandaracinus sp.]|nr:transcriptional regulator [Sandaracinus sp.]
MWILVVGPEPTLKRDDSCVDVLQSLGCRVRTADLWELVGEEELDSEPPAVVMVEALNEVDGARAALMRLRAARSLRDVPVIVAVSVQGLSRLDARDGFDDIVLHPYVPQELYLRIRRVEWARSDFNAHERIKMGAMVLDLAAHEVAVDGAPVKLTQQEFALLRFLCQNRGRVFSRQQLLERVWGVDYYGGSRTVDIHVRRLRMKLGGPMAALETVRGVGYKMRAPR